MEAIITITFHCITRIPDLNNGSNELPSAVLLSRHRSHARRLATSTYGRSNSDQRPPTWNEPGVFL